MPVAPGPFEPLLRDLKSILTIYSDPPKSVIEYSRQLYPLEQRIGEQIQDLTEAPFFMAMLELQTKEGFVNIRDLCMWSKLYILYLMWNRQLFRAKRDWAGDRRQLEELVDFYENASAFRG